ncbi:Ger(x)C family spore germination protein [Cohnella sp. GCM10027633]|uniref:Ger(x)C family spore germination protein n=1 Tax=unclassified Cohnella TaxID=2636738 RepID=UPI003645473D
MIRYAARLGIMLLLACLLSGCTDFVEPNQLAFVLGTAVDQAEDGSIEISHQIVVPTHKNSPIMGESSQNKGSFIVLSAVGRDVFEASQKIQAMMSRKLITSHRMVIAVGESFFGKNDARKLFDKLNRDPANNQRDVIVVVRGSAKAFIRLNHPMEHLSSVGVGKELNVNGLTKFTTRQFLIDSISDGQRPIVPMIRYEKTRLSEENAKTLASLSGFAILDKRLKVRTVLNETDGMDAVWMAGKGTTQGMTIPWKDGKGLLSFRLTHLKRRIRSAGSGDPGSVSLTVRAQAYLLENTAGIDTSKVENVIEIQTYLNGKIAERLQAIMDECRRSGTDAYGIGAYLHRTRPGWWKSHKDDWDGQFARLRVEVKSNVSIRSTGTSSS